MSISSQDAMVLGKWAAEQACPICGEGLTLLVARNTVVMHTCHGKRSVPEGAGEGEVVAEHTLLNGDRVQYYSDASGRARARIVAKGVTGVEKAEEEAGGGR